MVDLDPAVANATEERSRALETAVRHRESWASAVGAAYSEWMGIQLARHAKFQHSVTDNMSDADIRAVKVAVQEIASDVESNLPSTFTDHPQSLRPEGNRATYEFVQLLAKDLGAPWVDKFALELQSAGFAGDPTSGNWQFYQANGARSRGELPALPSTHDYVTALTKLEATDRKLASAEETVRRQRASERFGTL